MALFLRAVNSERHHLPRDRHLPERVSHSRLRFSLEDVFFREEILNCWPESRATAHIYAALDVFDFLGEYILNCNKRTLSHDIICRKYTITFKENSIGQRFSNMLFPGI